MPNVQASDMPTVTRSRHLLSVLLGVLILATLVVTLAGFAGRWHWYADLFNHLRPQYFMVLTLTLSLSLLAKLWRWVAVSLLGLLLNSLVLAPHAVPSPLHRPASA